MTVSLFIIGILFGATGGILMKLGASQYASIEVNSTYEAFNLFTKLITDFTVIAGISLYFLSAIAWLYLLTKLDISFVQPILALTYVVTPILAIIFLNEAVPLIRWVGIVIIIVGVAIVARSS